MCNISWVISTFVKNFDASLHKMAASDNYLDLDLRPPVMYLSIPKKILNQNMLQMPF